MQTHRQGDRNIENQARTDRHTHTQMQTHGPGDRNIENQARTDRQTDRQTDRRRQGITVILRMGD